jgi:hypothetical protein
VWGSSPARLALAGALVCACGAGAEAQPLGEPCQSYTRASAAAPEVVRGWLAHSSDEQVLVCPQAAPRGAEEPGNPAYFGESALRRRGAVCSYSSHGLTRIGAGAAAHLESYERGEALAMAFAGADCPPPRAPSAATPYTATYDVSPSAFVAIMRFWAAAAAHTEDFDRELGRTARGGSEPEASAALGARTRLRAAIEGGRMQAAAVTRIVRISGFGLRHRYALFVADPDSRPPGSTLYVIYLSKWPTGPYHITGIADAAN